jgi:hypothetical protein
LWIVLTAAWIATIAGIDRPDKQIALARQPILISWSQEPYAVATIEFPAEIDQGTIAKAINNWIAELNVILVKLRTGLTLSSLSDEELRTLASRLGLDDKRSISDIRRQIADRMRMTDLPPLPPGFVLDTPPSVPPLVLDGDELAAGYPPLSKHTWLSLPCSSRACSLTDLTRCPPRTLSEACWGVTIWSDDA